MALAASHPVAYHFQTFQERRDLGGALANLIRLGVAKSGEDARLGRRGGFERKRWFFGV